MSLATQRVVIPKGLVNPYSMTIVEIPQHLQNVDTVVAKAKIGSPSTPMMTTVGMSANSPRITERRSFNGRSPSPGRTYPNWCYEETPYEGHGHPYHSYEPNVPNGPHKSYHPPVQHNYNLEIEEGPAYADHKVQDRPPRSKSALPKSRAHSPVRYQSSIPEQKIPPSSVTFAPTVVEGNNYEQPINNQVYYEVHPEAPPTTPSGPGNVSNTPKCDQEDLNYDDPSACVTKRLDSRNNKELSKNQIITSLDQLETTELHRLMEDLNNFQSARRRLVFNASSLASASEVSENLLKLR